MAAFKKERKMKVYAQSGYHYIECNKRKTKECDLLPIREVELKTIMEQVAGRRENVERIILFDGHIDFLMKDGTVKSHITYEFDAGIWSSLVQEVIVKSKDDIRFIFKNGFEVRV